MTIEHDPSHPDPRDTEIAALRAEIAKLSAECDLLGEQSDMHQDNFLRVSKEIARLRAHRDALAAENVDLRCRLSETPAWVLTWPYSAILAAANTALRARVDNLEAALKPFAAMRFSFDGYSCDDAEVVLLGITANRTWGLVWDPRILKRQ